VNCHACGRDVPLAPGERVGFRDECEGCRADLHVCRNCAHHDPSAYNACREPAAERISDGERANRCDWFAPGGAGGEGDAEALRRGKLARAEGLFRR
jgi:hypothetical protein